ncbi:MAG: proton-conducting transporter membrane subunit, partial [Litorilinea sp.]
FAAGYQQALALIGTLLNLVIAVWIFSATVDGTRYAQQAGLWPAPFGITLMVDGLSALMLLASGVLGFAGVLYSMGTLDARASMNYYPLMLFLLMGVNGAFLAGDLFNLYVFFEVMLMSSFALLTLGGQIGQINGGIRYVLLNLLASSFFLMAIAVIYGSVGTLNMAQLAQRMDSVPPSVQLLAGGLLFIAFGTKAGIFPLYFWLPSSYHTPHPAITALFGGMLTKVGIYSLYRVFPLVFAIQIAEWQTAILILAGLTMVVGGFGAMAVNTMRRVLSYHVISQVGYMIMGLGLAAGSDLTLATFGLAAGIIYALQHMLVKTALMMAGGAAEMDAASGSLLSSQMAGLSGRRPVLAVLFFVAAMSLAGIPPSSAFLSKLGLLQGAVMGGHWTMAAVAMFTALITLMSMVRLWQHAFWGKPSEVVNRVSPLQDLAKSRFIYAPIALLLVISLSMGIFGGSVFNWTQRAATHALDRAGYIETVAPMDEIPFAGAYGE